MYINHNGKLTDNVLGMDFNNRAYQYGDALFETIKYKNGRALFLNDHFERLIKGMHLLSLVVPDFFSVDYLSEQFNKLANKNNCETASRIRIQVYRDSSGYYFPSGNRSGFTITVEALSGADYILNEHPIKIKAYTENYKTKTPLSNIKSSNALLYILAAHFARAKGYNDCYILNEDGNIAEAISSNVFIIEKGNLVTPPLTDGGVAGVMRKQLIHIATAEHITCIEKSISLDDINNAAEVILTNVIKGITRVIGNAEVKPTLQHFINRLNSK